MEINALWSGLIAYVVLGRFILRLFAGITREITFATLNLGAVYFFLFYGHHAYYGLRFGFYLVMVMIQFLFLRVFVGRRDWLPWIAFIVPIIALVFFRYLPVNIFKISTSTLGIKFPGIPTMIGLSYLSFRCSRLVLEVRNGLVKVPNFVEYLNFAFFLPTMPVGPINTYANYRRGFTEKYNVPMERAVLRILVGVVKYELLANLCNRLSYSGLLFDGHPHHFLDLPVAMLFFYLYLFCNFSGFCDLAIGAAGLIGIPVPENFNNPFAARNVKDFWNRWHITLSSWMRDVVFSPLSKYFVHVLGVRLADHAIALTIAIVFLLVGVWHGVGWNFVAYGATHALGVVTNHYYTIFLKRKLGRERFKAYNENRWIHAAAVALTFCYCGASLIFFANTFPQIQNIFESLR